MPILALIIMLTLLKAPAYLAAFTALGISAVEALFVFGLPLGEIGKCTLRGVASGLFPIGLVIISALLTYALTVESKAMDEIKKMLGSLSSDYRYLALIVIWGFGNFMEGMAGFGTAVAIPCAILVGIGFDPVKAVLCALVANTTPTAFGSVGVPTMALADETALGLGTLSSKIVLLQIAATSLSPFLILFITDGFRGLKEKFHLALIADIAFILPWVATALTLGCELPDVIGGISVMIVLGAMGNFRSINAKRALWAWMPFAFVVIILGVAAFLPHDKKISPGILILIAGILGALAQRIRPLRIIALFFITLKKYALAITTICFVLALAKIMGASGMTAILAKCLMKISGSMYPLLASVVGSLGGFITGSGTSSNVLFGALQASAGATEFEKLLFASANVMGAGIGKMICPQSIVLGCAATGLAGKESEIMKKVVVFFLIVLAVASIATFIFFRAQ